MIRVQWKLRNSWKVISATQKCPSEIISQSLAPFSALLYWYTSSYHIHDSLLVEVFTVWLLHFFLLPSVWNIYEYVRYCSCKLSIVRHCKSSIVRHGSAKTFWLHLKTLSCTSHIFLMMYHSSVFPIHVQWNLYIKTILGTDKTWFLYTGGLYMQVQ